jgi:hypothetical protein
VIPRQLGVLGGIVTAPTCLLHPRAGHVDSNDYDPSNGPKVGAEMKKVVAQILPAVTC